MKNYYYFAILFLIFNILLLTASASSNFYELILKKLLEKKKKVDKKPASVSQELFCNSCQAIVQEVLKKVHDSKKESDVIDALDHLCDMKNFYVYEYPPPEMRKGCEAFYDAYYDKLESELIKRIDNESIQERICNKVTKVCVGEHKKIKGRSSEKIIKFQTQLKQLYQKEEEEDKKRKQEQENEEQNQQRQENPSEEINLDNTDKQEEL